MRRGWAGDDVTIMTSRTATCRITGLRAHARVRRSFNYATTNMNYVFGYDLNQSRKYVGLHDMTLTDGITASHHGELGLRLVTLATSKSRGQNSRRFSTIHVKNRAGFTPSGAPVQKNVGAPNI